MNTIKLIIADDDNFVREGMQIILNADDDFDVVGCASNGKDAVELASQTHPDLILMDIQMPIMDGIESTRIIVEQNLGKVLILTTFDDYELVEQAIQNGAKGYLIKNHTPEQLKQMIKTIHSGINVVDQTVIQKLTQEKTPVPKGFHKELYTPRELDIIRLVSDGLSNKEIAAELFLTEGTIKNYISTILEKENLEHRTKLAIYYLTGKKG